MIQQQTEQPEMVAHNQKYLIRQQTIANTLTLHQTTTKFHDMAADDNKYHNAAADNNNLK
jgi:hypothetical protein